MGIVGIYAVFVYAVGVALRAYTTRIITEAVYTDPDTTESIELICNNLYTARKLKLFKVEKLLHTQLRDIVRDLEKFYNETTTPRQKAD